MIKDKKLNNKGYMLIEIILASAIAFGLAYFMLELTLKLKNKNDDLLVETLTNTDNAIISNAIMKYLNENSDGVNTICGDRIITKDTDNNKFKIGAIEINGQKVFVGGNFVTEINKYAYVDIASMTESNCEFLNSGKKLHISIPLKIVNTKKSKTIILYYRVKS